MTLSEQAMDAVNEQFKYEDYFSPREIIEAYLAALLPVSVESKVIAAIEAELEKWTEDNPWQNGYSRGVQACLDIVRGAAELKVEA